MKYDDGMTTFRKVHSFEVMIRSKVWPNICETLPSTSEQAIWFLLEILEKTVINMFIKVFADGKLTMAWLYINKRETIFL